MITKLSRHRLGLAIMALLSVPYHAFATDPVSLQQHALAVKSWPDQVRPPPGAPNVLIIMSDDVGYGSARSFGGRIPTPAFDEVGETGLRYTHFMTAAVCSPTRASLLTGRLPQEVGIGYPTNWPTPYPGYHTVIPESAATIADYLRSAGYATAMIGKAHVTPEWELGPTGPFERWPSGLGFDYYYGIMGADTSLFEPNLVENTRFVPRPEQADYHLERDLADHAITWLREHAAVADGRPFFMYYAMPSAHAPHHAPDDWLQRFHGQFDDGWEQLRAQTLERQQELGIVPEDVMDVARPEGLPRWDELDDDQRALYARYMEAYAASLAYADAQAKRVLTELDHLGLREDTLVIYLQGDNGASAEGRPHGLMYEQSGLNRVQESQQDNAARGAAIGTADSYPLIPSTWGWAMNAPFQWAKRYASHFGGTRNAMAVSWPAGIKARGYRTQLHHVSDIMPTVLEIVGIQPMAVFAGVAQQPVTGISLRYTFEQEHAPSRRQRLVAVSAQTMALIDDGWMVAATPTSSPWGRTGQEGVVPTERRWELYDLGRDFNQRHNLAAQYPERVHALTTLFWQEAERARMLPIHTHEGAQQGMPGERAPGEVLRFTRPVAGIPGSAAPRVVGRSLRLSADVETSAHSGVLVAHGGRYAGYALFLHERRIHFSYRLNPQTGWSFACPLPESAQRVSAFVEIRMETPQPGSAASVRIGCAGGREQAEGRLPQTFPVIISHNEPFDIGQDTVSPVDARYTVATSKLQFDQADIRYEWLHD